MLMQLHFHQTEPCMSSKICDVFSGPEASKQPKVVGLSLGLSERIINLLLIRAVGGCSCSSVLHIQ